MKKIVATVELPFLEGDIVQQWIQAKEAWNAAFTLLRSKLETECRSVFEACGQRPLQALRDCEDSVHFNYAREGFIFTVMVRNGNWISHFSTPRNVGETWASSLSMVREQTAWLTAQAELAREIVLNTLSK